MKHHGFYRILKTSKSIAVGVKIRQVLRDDISNIGLDIFPYFSINKKMRNRTSTLFYLAGH